MSVLHINELPDLCLRTIFEKLPLVDLLRVDQVCDHWASLAPDVRINRSILAIVIGDQDYTRRNLHFYSVNSEFTIPYSDKLKPPLKEYINFKDNVVTYEWFDSDAAMLLTTHLPNISTLYIKFSQVPSRSLGIREWGQKSVLVDQILFLFQEWFDTLKTLILDTDFKTSYDVKKARALQPPLKEVTQGLHHLLGTINTLGSLTHLSFFTTIFDWHNTKNPKLVDLPIISRLSEVNLKFPDFRYVNDSLVKYASTNHKPNSIGISGVNYVIQDRLINHWYSDFIAPKITYLPMQELCTLEDLQNICAKFLKLKRITIVIDSLKPGFSTWVRTLLPLKELTCLGLYIMSNEKKSSKKRKNEDMNLEMQSIRVLSLHTKELTPAFDQTQCKRFFPNLEILHYEAWFDEEFKDEMLDDFEFENYLNRQLMPWKNCAKLHTIYAGSQSKDFGIMKNWRKLKFDKLLGNWVKVMN